MIPDVENIPDENISINLYPITQNEYTFIPPTTKSKKRNKSELIGTYQHPNPPKLTLTQNFK